MVNKNSRSYTNEGVVITPAKPAIGDKVKILYDGILAKSGATDIYAHVGYGHAFENPNDIKMTPTSVGFEVTIPALKSDILSVCFKDNANNWDNNAGNNYLFNIE